MAWYGKEGHHGATAATTTSRGLAVPKLMAVVMVVRQVVMMVMASTYVWICVWMVMVMFDDSDDVCGH